MSWEEAQWISRQVSKNFKDYDIKYLVGSHKEITFPRSTRISPVDCIYGLCDPNRNYALLASDENTSFAISETLMSKADVIATGVYPSQETENFIHKPSQKIGTEKTLVGTLVLKDPITDFKNHGTIYGVCITGSIGHRYAAENGIRLYVVVNDDTNNPIELATISESSESGYKTSKISSVSKIDAFTGIADALCTSIKVYAEATSYKESASVYFYDTDLTVRVARYTKSSVPTVFDFDTAWSYFLNRLSALASVSVDKKLLGIPGSSNNYTVFDGDNYYVCDSVNIYTGKYMKRVVTGTVELTTARTYTFEQISENPVYLPLAVFYANGASFTVTKDPSKITITFDKAYTGTLYWAAPLVKSVESTALVVNKTEERIAGGTLHNVNSSAIVKYYQTYSAKGDVEVDSFYCASEYINNLKNKLTGSIPINGIRSSLHDTGTHEELDNLCNYYADVFCNKHSRSKLGLATSWSEGERLLFINNTVSVNVYFDGVGKHYMLSSKDDTDISNITIATDGAFSYDVGLCKWSDCSGYIYYYGYNSETACRTATTYRPFSISATGAISLATAFTFGATETAALKYDIDEFPMIYDQQGMCFLVTTKNYARIVHDGWDEYVQTSEVYNLYTKYFRHLTNGYSSIPNGQSSAIGLGTNYDFMYYQDDGTTVYYYKGKTSTHLSIKNAYSYFESLLIKDGICAYNNPVSLTLLPFIDRTDMTYNSAEDPIVTGTSSYLYSMDGDWRGLPKSINYYKCTINASTGDITTAIDKPTISPMAISGNFMVIPSLSPDILFLNIKSNNVKYSSKWMDDMFEPYVYDPINYGITKCNLSMSEILKQ